MASFFVHSFIISQTHADSAGEKNFFQYVWLVVAGACEGVDKQV